MKHALRKPRTVVVHLAILFWITAVAFPPLTAAYRRQSGSLAMTSRTCGSEAEVSVSS